ncbi:MAG: hypothetical protein JO164_04835 [Candidatus Eremiobacteraeota bacterium]|nr:hypothetical protein [Candidatus Eremiobacteraeota bacterium]
MERFKVLASRANDELKARRDYEYEARKRLYVETEPILFQFYENAAYVINRILNLARASRDGSLEGSQSWWRDQYYLLSAVHGFLAPLAAFHILRQRITLLDLTLDDSLERQYELGKAANRVWSRDISLASSLYELRYNPNRQDVEKQSLAPDEESMYRRQGVLSGYVQRAAAALVFTNDGEQRVRSFSEFADAYENNELTVQRDVEPVLKVLDGFVPARHPVLWRVIVAQLFVYRAIRLYRERELTNIQLLERVRLSEVELRDFSFSLAREDQERVHEAYAVGLQFLAQSLEARGRFSA